jgi:hypothetical protein
MNEPPVQRFNLATMSGIFPGTRTMVYQRVQLASLDAGSAATAWRWARILWYTDPLACVVELEAAAGSPATPLVRIAEPAAATLAAVLAEALATVGWRLRTCGTCAHWQPTPARTLDDLPAGDCTQRSTGTAPPAMLATQSLLALPCDHWAAADRAVAERAATVESAPATTLAPIRKRAEQESDERWSWIGQIRRWLRKSAPARVAPALTWEERIVERSGVGAGTEPCFACQGRIANLGALAVATPEGDKQTFSVWRCRNCYTCYLNDWIDRWERTDTLETEERYYRLTPAEALEALAVIDNVVHAEHPARRHERDAQRTWMLAFSAEHALLSHQIRQGR